MLNITKNSRFFVCGDTHGNHEISKLNTTLWPEQKDLTENDVLIQVGDFGLIWQQEQDSEERFWLEWLDSKPFFTLFIAGNHENHWRLNSYPDVPFYGGRASFISRKVILLKDGYVYTFGDKKFFMFGGAYSPDKEFRVLGRSWWPEEIPSYKTMLAGIINLEKENYNIDYIITHTIPSSIISVLGVQDIYNDPVSVYLENIRMQFIERNKLYKHWFAGHWHIDKTFDDFNFSITYNNKPMEIK